MRFTLCLLAYFGLIVIAMLCLDPARLPVWRVMVGLFAYGLALTVARMPWRKKP